MEERDKEGRTPAEERAQIGTPAGEAPEEGRKRHETQPLNPDQEEDMQPTPRDTIEDDDDLPLEEFSETGDEISTTGGITGTHVRGGIPAGGSTSGGTRTNPEETRSWDYKKT